MDLNGLAAKAAKVADMNARNRASAKELREAQSAVLASIVESVKPALPFLTGPIPVARTKTGTRYERTVRGLRVFGDPIGQTSFSYQYLLTDDGSLVCVDELSEQDELADDEHAETEVTPATLDELIDHVEVREFGVLVTQFVGAIDRALDAQLRGKLDKRTAEMQETAADLRAIARLASRKGV